MENKTIRVWDKEISCCNQCKYSQFNSFEGTCICREINSNRVTIGSRDKEHSEPIYPDCPFSKPLSKEDIESCIHTNTEDFRTIFKLREKYTNELCFQTYWLEEKEWLDEEYIYWNTEHNTLKITHKSKTMFSGYINNLPEFKLILKQLNIE